ncbi:MAG: HEAT repeat domain-containing protein [Candidatus Riflebacteria bacterium]|nr:HEAT repeat domain-containing protein [Candidatus Riflebacteria bacterium]
MSEPAQTDVLLIDLESPDEPARRAAIFALATAGEIRAIPQLKRMSAQDDSMELRYLARKALHMMGARDPVARSLVAPPSAHDSRKLAVGPLELIGPRLADPDPAKRASALRAAARKGDPVLLPAVLDRVGKEDSPEVRSLLVQVVAILGGKAQLPVIGQHLSDPDVRVRANTVEALEELDDVGAWALIIRALQDPDHRVKVNAVRALGKLGKLNLIRCCRAMVVSKDYWLRDAAVHCLASARLPEAVSLLEKALGDSYEAVRVKARRGLKVLAEMNVPEAVDALQKAENIKEKEDPEDFLKLEKLVPEPRPDALKSRDVPVAPGGHDSRGGRHGGRFGRRARGVRAGPVRPARSVPGGAVQGHHRAQG